MNRPTTDKPQSEHRNRSKSNVVKKVQEIKEAFRLKNLDERKDYPSSTVLPTFQSDMPSFPRNFTKYFVPVIADLNGSNGQSLGIGDYLFARYRLDQLVIENAAYSIYEGSIVDSNEKVQIKIFRTNHSSLALGELTNYMRIYEGSLMKDGWMAQLKDFFFYKGRLILVLKQWGHSMRKIKSTVSPQIVKSIVSRLFERIKSLHAEGILHLNINPTCIQFNIINEENIEIGLSDLTMAQAKDRQNRFESPGMSFETQNYWSPQSLLHVVSAIIQLSVDEKSDIWSVGCVLYWLVSGRPLLQPQLSTKEMIYVMKKSLSKSSSGKKSSAQLPEGDILGVEAMKGSGNRLHIMEENIRDIDKILTGIHNKDPELSDLLLSLLRINPSKRASSELALCHCWFSSR